MKRIKLLPSIIMIVLCVAVLAVGVYSFSPLSCQIDGELKIIGAAELADIIVYIDDQQIYSSGVSSTSSVSIAKDLLQFDMRYAGSIDEVTDIQMRVKIENKSNSPIGAYFYSGSGTYSDNITDATCVQTNGTISNSSGVVIANTTMSSYTYIAPLNTTDDYDIGDLYINISLAQLFTEEIESGTLNLNLCLEEYKVSYSGTLVKLANTTTQITSSTITNKSAQIVVMPSSVTSIADGSFTNLTSLTSVIVPDSVTSVNVGIFSGCTSLTQITSALQLVSTVANNQTAFASFTSLKTYFFRGEEINSQFDNITSDLKLVLTNKLTCVIEAFYQSYGIKKLYIPTNIILGTYDGFWGTPAFSWACGIITLKTSSEFSPSTFLEILESIKNIVFTNNVETIDNVQSLALTQVTIPENAKVVGGSFNYCVLETIIYKGTESQWASKTNGITWATNCSGSMSVICSDTE